MSVFNDGVRVEVFARNYGVAKEQYFASRRHFRVEKPSLQDGSHCNVLRRFLYICILVFLFGGCSNPKPNLSTESGEASSSDIGPRHFRVQTSYEVIKTGEIIEFDFVYSCESLGAPGDSTPGVGPSFMYKATQDGGAIGIRARTWPCSKLSHVVGHEIEEIAFTVWYPDVENMKVGFAYVSADAFTGPSAKIRVLNYDIENSSKADRLKWLAKAEAEYVQKGDLPGPFGVGMHNSPYEIRDPDQQYVYYYVQEMTQDFHDLFRPIYQPDNGRFTCFGGPNTSRSLREYLGLNDDVLLTQQNVPKLHSQIRWDQRKLNIEKYSKYAVDLPTAKGLSEFVRLYDSKHDPSRERTRQIREIYPARAIAWEEDKPSYIVHGEKKSMQILEDDSVKGFAFSQYAYFSLESFSNMSISAPSQPGVYVNNVKACDRVWSGFSAEIHDWDRKIIYKSQGWTSE